MIYFHIIFAYVQEDFSISGTLPVSTIGWDKEMYWMMCIM